MVGLVSTRLRRARQNAGLMQAQLAEQLGVYPSRISEWERGQHQPRADVLIRWEEICQAQAAIREREEQEHAQDLRDLRQWFDQWCRDHRLRATLRTVKQWLKGYHPVHLSDARAIWFMGPSRPGR